MFLKVVTLTLLLCVYAEAFWGEDETSKKVFVQNVKQKYTLNTNKLIESQIQTELEASYFYQAYASYFQRADVDLPGVQKFFTDASAEEKQHAQMLIEYVNKRGGHTQFDEINLMNAYNAVSYQNKTTAHRYYVDVDKKQRMCIFKFIWNSDVSTTCGKRSSWKEALFAFQDALALERYVNYQLLQLHKAAETAEDAHLTHFLEHEFLEEQVEAINQLGHYVSRLRSFKGDSYALGEYLFDQKLTK